MTGRQEGRGHGRRRLLACDLDGTLLTASGKLTDAVSSALFRAARAGFTLAVITARPQRDVEPAVRDRIPASAYWAYSNGAWVQRPTERLARRLAGIPPAAVPHLLAVLRAARPHWSVALDLSDTTVLVDPFPQADSRYWNQVVRCRSVSELVLTEPLSKLLVRTGTVCDEVVTAQVQRLVGDAVVATASGGRYVELGPPGAGKADALRWICAEERVAPTRVVAVGDGLNDRAMLRLAGLSAVPANAPEEVRRLADLRLPTNDEDAVAVLVDLLLTGTPDDG